MRVKRKPNQLFSVSEHGHMLNREETSGSKPCQDASKNAKKLKSSSKILPQNNQTFSQPCETEDDDALLEFLRKKNLEEETCSTITNDVKTPLPEMSTLDISTMNEDDTKIKPKKPRRSKIKSITNSESNEIHHSIKERNENEIISSVADMPSQTIKPILEKDNIVQNGTSSTNESLANEILTKNLVHFILNQIDHCPRDGSNSAESESDDSCIIKLIENNKQKEEKKKTKKQKDKNLKRKLNSNEESHELSISDLSDNSDEIISNEIQPIEENPVDEKIKQKIQKKLHIDVTDKYNFVKQTTRTKLRPKVTSSKILKHKLKFVRKYKIKNNYLKKKDKIISDKHNISENHFLGFDKAVKRFDKHFNWKNIPVNRSYFNWDDYKIKINKNVHNLNGDQNKQINILSFENEMDFLFYNLINEKIKSTFDCKLQNRLTHCIKISKSKLVGSKNEWPKEQFQLIENGELLGWKLNDLNCDMRMLEVNANDVKQWDLTNKLLKRAPESVDCRGTIEPGESKLCEGIFQQAQVNEHCEGILQQTQVSENCEGILQQTQVSEHCEGILQQTLVSENCKGMLQQTPLSEHCDEILKQAQEKVEPVKFRLWALTNEILQQIQETKQCYDKGEMERLRGAERFEIGNSDFDLEVIEQWTLMNEALEKAEQGEKIKQSPRKRKYFQDVLGPVVQNSFAFGKSCKLTLNDVKLNNTNEETMMDAIEKKQKELSNRVHHIRPENNITNMNMVQVKLDNISHEHFDWKSMLKCKNGNETMSMTTEIEIDLSSEENNEKLLKSDCETDSNETSLTQGKSLVISPTSSSRKLWKSDCETVSNETTLISEKSLIISPTNFDSVSSETRIWSPTNSNKKFVKSHSESVSNEIILISEKSLVKSPTHSESIHETGLTPDKSLVLSSTNSELLKSSSVYLDFKRINTKRHCRSSKSSPIQSCPKIQISYNPPHSTVDKISKPAGLDEIVHKNDHRINKFKSQIKSHSENSISTRKHSINKKTKKNKKRRCENDCQTWLSARDKRKKRMSDIKAKRNNLKEIQKKSKIRSSFKKSDCGRKDRSIDCQTLYEPRIGEPTHDVSVNNANTPRISMYDIIKTKKRKSLFNSSTHFSNDSIFFQKNNHKIYSFIENRDKLNNLPLFIDKVISRKKIDLLNNIIRNINSKTNENNSTVLNTKEKIEEKLSTDRTLYRDKFPLSRKSSDLCHLMLISKQIKLI